MLDDIRRRTVLGGIGATIGSLAGCEAERDAGSSGSDITDGDSTAASQETPVPAHTHATQNQGGAALSPETLTAETVSAAQVAGRAFESPGAEASFIIDQVDGITIAVDPDTRAREFESDHAGDVFAAVLNRLREQGGGRVFIRQNTYTLHRELAIRGSNIQLASDFATLDFYDHDRSEMGREVESDLIVNPMDDPARNIEISGLIVNGNKTDRTAKGTRTVDVWTGSHIRFEKCIIYGGKGDEGGGGYGIGEGLGTDYVTIDNCVIRDADRHAYHPSADHHSITNSVFLNNATKGGDVFDLAYSKALVANNHFENNGRGVRIDSNVDKTRDQSVLSFVNNTFIDNYSTGEATGQLILSHPHSSSILIEGNTFSLPTSVSDGSPTRHMSADIGAVTDTLTMRDNQFIGGVDEFSTFHDEGGELRTVILEDNVFDAIPTMRFQAITNLVFRGNTFTNLQLPRERAFQIVSDGVERGIVADNVLFDYNGVPMADSMNGAGVLVKDNEYL